ncbi:hypothetical protein B5P44_31780 [Mycobacterium sp. CBMA 213]|nr:hypothetical protein [Mycolicibacterium sp. CBMA 213]
MLLRSMLWDVLPALAVYYGARAAGAGPVPALIGGSACAAIRVAWVAARRRSIDSLSILLLLGFALGLVLSMFFQSPGAVLLKDSATTAVSGLVFLISALIGRPLTFAVVLRAAGDDAEHRADLNARWSAEAGFRRRFIVVSTVWGIGLLVEALARIPLVLALPADDAVVGSNLLGVGIIGALFGWSAWYRRRAQARSGQPARSGSPISG